MLRLLLRLAAVIAAAVLASPAHHASAEIQKLMQMCPGQKLCPWFKAVVSPPPGWVEDKEFGTSRFVTALFPDKGELGPKDPLIYVQVSWHRDRQTLEENIADNQRLWRKSEPRVKITPLPDVARGDGKTAFKVFLYENPTHPKQAFETIAFALEPQPDGNHYIITVVDTASNRHAIDASRDAYRAILRQL